jgi:hypothetical protein
MRRLASYRQQWQSVLSNRTPAGLALLPQSCFCTCLCPRCCACC